ncbi:hypothetical protein MMC17_005136 [Xylographa soralifera]|nr:hypothetical protein [Xylographa soralifera]
MTTEELIARFTTRSRFYSEPDFPSVVIPACARPPMTAVEAAAKAGDMNLLDRLVNTGADVEAWMHQYPDIPARASTSYLSVSTPLHRAVENEDYTTLPHLLVRGHWPDIFPLAPITRSFNAAMYTVTEEPPWPQGLALLAPRADFNFRTPIFECHILHLVVARLNLALLEKVISITRADIAILRPTALKHTLVHIACLSLDETWTNVHAATVYASIHEQRSTSDAHHAAQKNVVMFLLNASADVIAELKKQDVYDNTVLHYIAGNRCINEELLKELRRLSPIEWNTVQNAFGHGAKDLYEDGHSARKYYWDQRHMFFWQDPCGLWDGPVKTWIDWYTHPGKRFAA